MALCLDSGILRIAVLEAVCLPSSSDQVQAFGNAEDHGESSS